MTIDSRRTLDVVQHASNERIVPTLTEYIRVPAKSLAFDPDWRAHGHLDRAVTLVKDWCQARPIGGLRVDVVALEGRTPMIVMEVPGGPTTRCCCTVTSTSSRR